MKLIQQHYYSRTQCGYYQKTEGYDTIAKSKNLDDSFVKNILHKISVYMPPNTSSFSGDTRRYPEAITLIQPETGELVVGRSVFVPLDFKGERNTYFSHNYVIPRERRKDYIPYLNTLLYINTFESNGNCIISQELPEIEGLDYNDTQRYEIKKDELFRRLKINDNIFKSLIYTIFMSIKNLKRIYIALDVEVNELTYYSKAILGYLIEALPYEIRGKIGFTTYISNPKGTQYINIMFVERSNPELQREEVNYGYVYDFKRLRFPNFDQDLDKNEYLNFIAEHIEERKVLTDFYEFANRISDKIDDKANLPFDKFQKLLLLWKLGKPGYEREYKNLDDVFKTIDEYMIMPNIEDKEFLFNSIESIFVTEFNKHLAGSNYQISMSTVDKLMNYYDKFDEKFKMEINRKIILIIEKSYRDGTNEYIDKLLTKMSANNDILKAVIEQIVSSESLKKNILNRYIKNRLDKHENLEAICEEIIYWENICPILMRDEEILKKFIYKTKGILETARDQSLLMERWINIIKLQLKKENETKLNNDDNYYDPLVRINEEIFNIALNRFSLREPNLKHMKQVVALAELLNVDDEKNPKLYAIRCLNDLINDNVDFNILAKKTAGITGALKSDLRNYLFGSFVSEQKNKQDSKYNEDKLYGTLLLCYVYKKDDIVDFDIKELLNFLINNYGKKEAINFINWSANNYSVEVYDRENYKTAIKGFLKEKLPKELKRRKKLKTVFSSPNSEIYEEIFDGEKYGDKIQEEVYQPNYFDTDEHQIKNNRVITILRRFFLSRYGVAFLCFLIIICISLAAAKVILNKKNNAQRKTLNTAKSVNVSQKPLDKTLKEYLAKHTAEITKRIQTDMEETYYLKAQGYAYEYTCELSFDNKGNEEEIFKIRSQNYDPLQKISDNNSDELRKDQFKFNLKFNSQIIDVNKNGSLSKDKKDLIQAIVNLNIKYEVEKVICKYLNITPANKTTKYFPFGTSK